MNIGKKKRNAIEIAHRKGLSNEEISALTGLNEMCINKLLSDPRILLDDIAEAYRKIKLHRRSTNGVYDCNK